MERTKVKDIAHAAGVSTRTVLRWRKGESKLNTRKKELLAKSLNMPVSELFPDHLF